MKCFQLVVIRVDGFHMTMQAILQRVYGVKIVAVRQPRDLRLESGSFGLQSVTFLA
jgi:hypothetical protein